MGYRDHPDDGADTGRSRRSSGGSLVLASDASADGIMTKRDQHSILEMQVCLCVCLCVCLGIGIGISLRLKLKGIYVSLYWFTGDILCFIWNGALDSCDLLLS